MSTAALDSRLAELEATLAQLRGDVSRNIETVTRLALGLPGETESPALPSRGSRTTSNGSRLTLVGSAA
jgi:hypothetical protein